MSTNKEPWEPLLEKLIEGNASHDEQYVAVLTLFKGMNDNDINMLRHSSIPYNSTSLNRTIPMLERVLGENPNPKIREQIAVGFGNLGKILLQEITRIRPADTRRLHLVVEVIHNTLEEVYQKDKSETVRRAAIRAIKKITRPWWKFW